jgi:hypothetical protein
MLNNMDFACMAPGNVPFLLPPPVWCARGCVRMGVCTHLRIAAPPRGRISPVCERGEMGGGGYFINAFRMALQNLMKLTRPCFLKSSFGALLAAILGRVFSFYIPGLFSVFAFANPYCMGCIVTTLRRVVVSKGISRQDVCRQDPGTVA